MKKRISFILAIIVMFSILTTPIANAQDFELFSHQEENLIEIPIIDMEGNVLGIVTRPAKLEPIAVGAYVTFKGIQALIYTGYWWVCTHPEETVQTLQFLIDGFEAIQNAIGTLQSADHDGTKFVRATKTDGNICVPAPSGNQWVCMYSVEC